MRPALLRQVAIFVAVFVIAPMAQALFRAADIPNRLVPVAVLLSAGTELKFHCVMMSALAAPASAQSAPMMILFMCVSLVREPSSRRRDSCSTRALQARVFQPFFTTKPVGRGTGLGLATAKILVDRAGGTIELVSELGHGSCFTIRLPQANPHEQ